jgi:hypothetical protein
MLRIAGSEAARQAPNTYKASVKGILDKPSCKQTKFSLAGKLRFPVFFGDTDFALLTTYLT